MSEEDDQTEDWNAAAFHSLRGCAPLADVADCLRRGVASPELLAALADLIDPDETTAAMTDFRLALVGPNGRQIDWEKRRQIVDQARALSMFWIEGLANGKKIEAIVSEATQHLGVHRATVFRARPKLRLLNGYLVSTKGGLWDLSVKIAKLFPRR